MSRETQAYRRSLAESVGSGVRSIVNSSNCRYYILEHKIGSKYHHTGELQKIIVDQVEIGREPTCQVRFDEIFETVSRRHAAIIKDDDRLTLVPLSKTNPTLVNGTKIRSATLLQHGDEIQCAINGPKLGVIIPSGEQAMTSSISLNRRFSLFGKQALLPHKKKLIVWTSILCLLLLVGGFIFFIQ